MDKVKSLFLKTGKKNIIFICFVAFILLLIFLIVYLSNFRNFSEITLSKNSNKIFSVKDLTINNLKYGDKESDVKKFLGNPKEEKIKLEGSYNYKILKYNGLTVTLKEYYNDFILSKVEATSSKYKFSRNIKVGNRITKVFKKYSVKNRTGAYLYGNYTNNALSEVENKNNIYFGVRSTKNVLYVNRDEVLEGIPTNIAKLDISYKNGKINKITWSYDIK